MNTYSQISIHAVFAVKHRKKLLTHDIRDDIHSYISGIILNLKLKPLAVGGWLDHVHIFFGMPVTCTISDILRVVKGNSSRWINENNLISDTFKWQEGFGAFSYSITDRHKVIRYIQNQEEHHRYKNFEQEYIDLLNEFDVLYNDTYL
ncbi:MAG: IS200/IS605 family transposase [Bacteroidota bacterium]|nr:IS200/IS605 family transposase [Bacteroidota bacterium]